MGILVMLGCFVSVRADAQALRGDQLLSMLTGKKTSNAQGIVNQANGMGYLQGLMDSYMVVSTFNPGLQYYCMPEEGISVAQARQVVIRWLERHPERLKEQARILVFHALADAFPCKKE
jgi:hypothetical protein